VVEDLLDASAVRSLIVAGVGSAADVLRVQRLRGGSKRALAMTTDLAMAVRR
jgi:hypothetical protein